MPRPRRPVSSPDCPARAPPGGWSALGWGLPRLAGARESATAMALPRRRSCTAVAIVPACCAAESKAAETSGALLGFPGCGTPVTLGALNSLYYTLRRIIPPESDRSPFVSAQPQV